MSAASAPMLAPDAAMALGIASTALPFAQDRSDAAERWLRILRMHGRAGALLQALGVSEGPLYAERSTGEDIEGTVGGGGASSTVEDPDVVAQVIDRAVECAHRHGAAGVTTTDVLLAAMDVYGADFDRVLRTHGTDSEEVRARLE